LAEKYFKDFLVINRSSSKKTGIKLLQRNTSSVSRKPVKILSGLLSSALEQMQLGSAQEKWNEEQMAPWKGLGLLGAATRTFSDGYGTTNSEGTSTQKSGGGLGGLGGILSGIGKLV